MKVLQVMGSMNLGGAETYIMNIFRNIDRTKTQFDFAVYGDEKQYFEDEIIRLGGSVIRLPDISMKNTVKVYSAFRKIIKNGNYDVVHAHTNYNEAIPLLAAKKENVPVRVAHSHNTRNKNKLSAIEKMYMTAARKIIVKTATKLMGCSKQAMIDFYGSQQKSRFVFAPDAIDISLFMKSKNENHLVLKNEFHIPHNYKVIGHVGNFGDQKNHEYLINVFTEMLKLTPKLALVLIGTGSEKKIQEIKELVHKNKIDRNVYFLGRRSDIPQLMHCMDLFIFPSLYEGFGIVLLEAQAAGLRSLVSENIQPEVDVGMGMIEFLELRCGAEVWAKKAFELLNCPRVNNDTICAKFSESPYMIENAAKDLVQIYKNEKVGSRN